MSPRRGDPKTKESASGGLPTWVIAVGIGVVVIVAAVALFALQTPPAPAPVAQGTGSTAASRTKGDPNAKADFNEWSDFQ